MRPYLLTQVGVGYSLYGDSTATWAALESESEECVRPFLEEEEEALERVRTHRHEGQTGFAHVSVGRGMKEKNSSNFFL